MNDEGLSAAKAIEAVREDERVGRGMMGACSSTLAVSHDGLRHLLAENERLTKQVTELQAAATKQKDGSLYRMVRRFHEKFGHPVRHTPTEPTEEELRFRLSLVTEEYFELLSAALNIPESATHVIVDEMKATLRRASIRFDFEAFYDALLDLAYVIEGTHAVCGTKAEPGLSEVQRANMSKDPVYVAEKDATHARPDPKAKPRKPEGWVPPDIRAVLVAQGWTPPKEEP